MKSTKQLLITMAVLLCSFTANACDFEVDGIYYEIISETDYTVEVDEYQYTGNIVIPSTVNYDGNEYSVISIGYAAFDGCSSLTDIYLAGIPPKVGNNNFTYAQYMNTTLYVPEGLLERYKSADTYIFCKLAFVFYLHDATI